MSSRLRPILESTRRRVDALRGRGPDLGARARDRDAPRDFAAALRRPQRSGPVRVIGELKRRSPSAGSIREDLDPVDAARRLESAGAAALSVLTEPEFFGGSLEFLDAVRDAVELPLLRKDFVLDPIQVVEARAHGADAVLLLAVALDDAGIERCADEARAWGMGVLAEAHDAPELERLLTLDLPVIGVNARDLDTFDVDLQRGLELCRRIPEDRVAVAESGVRTRDDAEHVRATAVDAVLCGEGLMRPGTPEDRFAELFGGPVP
ncbi:MAG TPA: indole-3-glycerol phosphate synthase TrpC [Candidatus Krumholzibacteria bacterium]|nr:indole-3-glycerol phosphate synthase TrpC [Candidatus Krumholzibacteria bacterium]